MRRYAVVGDPVEHSLSPVIHNAAFGACGIDAEYVRERVPAGRASFDAFVAETAYLGLSVTLPHKTNALLYAGEDADALAVRIGAANTLLLDRARPYACNTDYAAILDALTAVLGLARDDLYSVRAVVLGAGGAARAAVAGLTAHGSAVVVCNRTAERAHELAAEFGAGVQDWSARDAIETDVLINTTSVGMAADAASTPFPAEALRADWVVFDTIYTPLETRLLREARAAGCTTVDGLEMFVRQGAAQFELFAGSSAPVEVMREAALVELQPDDGEPR